MSRLYDDVIHKGFGVPERHADRAPQISEILETATVVDISNVAHYYREQTGDGHRWSWLGGDFPNVAPPWENFWMEMDPKGNGIKDGLLFHCVELSGLEEKPFDLADQPIEDGWLITVIPFVRLSNERTDRRFVTMHLFASVGPHGERRAISPEDDGGWLGEPLEWEVNTLEGKTTFQAMMLNYQKWLIYPAFLALSFLHCKNVNLVAVDPPEKLNRARVKRGKKPLVRYHTLEIEPMKEVLRREGQIEKTGLKQALHICRGHFKDYRQHGLFGRNKGLYWWESHVRGSLKEGVVLKDYKVLEPNAGG